MAPTFGRSPTRGFSQSRCERGVVDEAQHRCGKRVRIAGRGHQTASFDLDRQPCPRLCRRHHRTARREDVAQLRRQHEVARPGDLRQQMDVREREQSPHPFGGLQIVELDVGQRGRELDQLAPVGAMAADHEHQVLAPAQSPRRLDHDPDALLVGDAARIERHLARADVPLAAVPIGIRFVGDKPLAGPVSQLVGAVRRDAHGVQACDHLRADRRDPVRKGKEAPLEPCGDPTRRARGVEQTRRECRLDFEILHMGPQLRAGEPCDKPRNRQRQQRRRHREHQVGAHPHRRAERRRQRRERERGVVHDPPHGSRLGRDVDPAAAHRHPVLCAPAGTRRTVAGALPLRVVGLADHGFERVTARRQPLGECGRIGSDPHRFGRVVQADDEDFHRAASVGRDAAWSTK